MYQNNALSAYNSFIQKQPLNQSTPSTSVRYNFFNIEHLNRKPNDLRYMNNRESKTK